MILLTLFLTFFKISIFTFGGGYAMIPLIKSEVIAKGWMDIKQLTDFIAISESTPGPFAINISTYIGTEKAGIIGAVCCTLGAVIPSLIIIILVARAYEKFRSNKIVEGCMSGLKPCIIGLIGSSVITIAKGVLFADGFSLNNFISFNMLFTIIILGIMIFLAVKKINPIIMILISAGLGISLGYLEKFITH